MINGQGPWRKSQLDVDKWVEQGFGRDLSKQYVDSILGNLVSKNVVVEARFPKAGEIMAVLDKEVNEYLVRAKDGLILEANKPQERLKVAQSMTDQWNQIIKAYNDRGDTVAPILEIYQRLRGVYVPNEEKNYLTTVRPIGLTLMAIIVASSLGAAAWVAWKRKAKVVRASQPFFLYLIGLGTLMMGSSIILMGVDDSIATQQGCSVARGKRNYELDFLYATSRVMRSGSIQDSRHNATILCGADDGSSLLQPCFWMDLSSVEAVMLIEPSSRRGAKTRGGTSNTAPAICASTRGDIGDAAVE